MQFLLEELDVQGKAAEMLARDITLKIANGVYADGSQLPSIRDISRETEVSDYWARKVIFELSRMGLVEVKARKGMYVIIGARAKAVEMLREYDGDIDLPKSNAQKTIAVAAAFKKTIDGPQIYHPQTISGIYREAQSLGFTVELINFNIDIADPDTIMKVVEANDYQGVIWLYPEASHWNSINKLRDNNIPVVLSSHWLFNTTLPCVQVNGYASTLSIVKHLVEHENCDVINWFSTEVYDKNNYADNDYSRVSASGGYQILKLAMDMLGDIHCKLNIIEYDGCRVSTERTLKQLVDAEDCRNGIVIANTQELSDFFKRHPECYEKIKKHSLVVASTINQLQKLEQMYEHLGDVNISLMPFEDVGRTLAMKINDLLEGRFVDNTTLINPSFGTYSELLQVQQQDEFSAASNINEMSGSLLTV